MHSSSPSRHSISQRRQGGVISILILVAGSFALAQTAPVPARSVPLLLPGAIAYDASGNLYIAEIQRHTLRQVDTLGNITSFAGDSTQGFSGDGGPAVNAQLNSPQGVAVDSVGNVYISDSSNNRVRRVDATSKIIQTIAGDGRSAFAGDGGPAATASFNRPRAICLDSTGTNLYVADTRNHRIRHINLTAGTIETVAGDGVQGLSGDGALATSASLDSPDSIALDAAGNLYLSDTHNQRLRRVAAATRIITTVIGPGAPGLPLAAGPAASSSLALPRGLALDPAGNIYLADSGNQRLLRIDGATGLISTAAGTATQGFSGDAGPAALATLDTPRAVALSPGGLVTIADAGNQRVRQLLGDPAPATPIQTIAGLGITVPAVFSLAATASPVYGSGTITASLNASQPASGQVTFLEVSGGLSVTIGTSPLASGVATLSLANVPAGQHLFRATYAGDATHTSAQTPAYSVSIAPLPLLATPSVASMIYGTIVPSLGGTLTGVLPQDAARVSASFSTTATTLSPADAYPISVALTGPAAANYLLQPAAANLLVTQANSLTLLRNSSFDSSFSGAVQVQVNSATSGTPAGTVSLLDNGSLLQRAGLTAGGAAVFSQIALAAGTHALIAIYSGGQNFLPSSSSPLTEFIATSPTPLADFAITAAAPVSQTLLPGVSITYNLAAQMIGSGLSSPIALSVSGLPAFTKSSFTPGYLPPGSSQVTPITLTITSLASSAINTHGSIWRTSAALALTFPLLGLLFRRPKGRRSLGSPTLFVALAALALAPTLIGCGARTNTTGQTSSPPQVYTLTVTGTATDSTGAPLAHSVSLTLTMNSL